ncbi:UNVERIFIED_CONTAM: hypothetical protein K2H54_001328 [Gekko kuhli]
MDGYIGVLPLEHDESVVRGNPEEECSVDCTKQKQTMEMGQSRMPEDETQPSVDLDDASSSIAAVPEKTSSTPTSEILPVSQPREMLWEQSQLEERAEELLDSRSLQLQAQFEKLRQEMQEMVLDLPCLITTMVQQELQMQQPPVPVGASGQQQQ